MLTTRLALCAYLLSAATAMAADCTGEVNSAFEKLRKLHAFNMKTTITNAQGTLTMSNDYILPDRMHQRVSLSTSGPQEMEMILIGDKAWSNQGSVGWAPLPPTFASKIAKQMKETVAQPPKDTSEFECLGDVELDGKSYKAYRTKRGAGDVASGSPAPKAAAGGTNVQTVYVDKETGIPARNIVTPEDDPKKRIFDGSFSLREDLKIEAPQS
jgi:hypothetical protein